MIFADDVYANLETNDEFTVTWFSEYPSMNLVVDEFAGGKVQYKLARNPLSVDYVWVYKNGLRLSQDIDYTVSLPRGVLYLVSGSIPSDQIKIVLFGDRPYQPPKAFEIFKDMLNNVHYKRFSKNADVKLSKDLLYYDSTIEITNGSLLADPIPSRKIPGVISINNERIEYFEKIGNVLSKLRRGSLGTAIAEIHNVNSFVVDVGATETLPYTETQERVDYTTSAVLTLIPDGTSRTFENIDDLYLGLGNSADISVKINGTLISSTQYIVNIDQGTLRFLDTISLEETDRVEITPLLVGPLDFVPTRGIRNSWYRNTIPLEYGPCDQIEVFQAGTRLRKNPMDVYQEDAGLTSPSADIIEEAEFSVNGADSYIRLTNEADANTRITIMRKQGNLWYERGANTASSGISLVENNTAVAEFISIKSTELPE